MNKIFLEDLQSIMQDSQGYLLEQIRQSRFELVELELLHQIKINELEGKLVESNRIINEVYRSPRYLTGKLLLAPFTIIKKIVQRF